MDNDRYKKFLVDMASGGTAAAVAKTTTAPVERVKLLLQVGINQLIVSFYVQSY